MLAPRLWGTLDSSTDFIRKVFRIVKSSLWNFYRVAVAFRANLSESKNSHLRLERGSPKGVFQGHAHITSWLLELEFNRLTHFSFSLLEVGVKRESVQNWKISIPFSFSCINLEVHLKKILLNFILVDIMENMFPKPISNSVKGSLNRWNL